jgi:hypothetical protein
MHEPSNNVIGHAMIQPAGQISSSSNTSNELEILASAPRIYCVVPSHLDRKCMFQDNSSALNCTACASKGDFDMRDDGMDNNTHVEVHVTGVGKGFERKISRKGERPEV